MEKINLFKYLGKTVCILYFTFTAQFGLIWNNECGSILHNIFNIGRIVYLSTGKHRQYHQCLYKNIESKTKGRRWRHKTVSAMFKQYLYNNIYDMILAIVKRKFTVTKLLKKHFSDFNFPDLAPFYDLCHKTLRFF